MGELLQMYDDLKNDVAKTTPAPIPPMADSQYKAIVNKEAEKLSADCAKKVLLDIYCRVIPLDSDYVKGNMGVVKKDVDDFLKSKDQNALQYFTSCKEKTDAPLLEFIVRNCVNIGEHFKEAAEEIRKDAKKNDINTPPPSADSDSVEVKNEIEGITGNEEKKEKGDLEYEEFIDKIKKKTVKRIIDEVSELINNKKSSKDTELNLEESAVAVAMDYMTEKFLRENVELTDNQEEMIIAMAIREATLNTIDDVLNSSSTFKEYKSNIRFGKGVVVNEGAVAFIKESVK